MRYFFICSILFSQFIYAQTSYPENYFRSPLDIPIVLAGTFGELRSNHFHSGMDIKTQQREGLDVHAVANGYVSRIKIQHYGYGKAIYVTHPNGYTSVYGHLQRFSPEIEAYVKKHQYKNQSYEIELFPESNEFPLKKGDIIAFSGNTGGSGGPHLHFEIRDSAAKPINPLLFGYEVKDTKAPRILGVYAYPLANGAIINNGNKRTELQLVKQADGTYLANKITASGNIGLGVETYDQLDMAYNKNGAYKVCLTVNGTLNFEYDFETFSFNESRYINTLIDYPTYIEDNKRIQKCYIEPYNKLSIYKKRNDEGIIPIAEGLSYQIVMEVSDFAGNTSTIIVPVEGKKQELIHKKDDANTGKYLIAARDNIYKVGDATAFFPANTFYHDFFIDLKGTGDSISIHNESVAVKSNYTISMDINRLNEDDISKLFIAHLDEDDRPSYEHTYRKGNILSTRTRDLGRFTVMKDTISPTVRPSNFRDGQWLSNFGNIKLEIHDDLSGINSYRATINGEWILMEYEYKDNTLTYDLNDIDFKDSANYLEVFVTDNVGNNTTFNAVFYRK
ncbi:M23 family metallopeptidase [Galbibacter pacificus]|uniref:M23 family metallopeptidase n=1 Tax=Galbibacter pacificus TaxID=2996052 RepID=A0ABT6FV09_9FLAO|nr:M23 family metallopeptidase [Galbibacter pacificus]MDG3583443.1 M23 family metallopeptidase [Galbibacter pacificus]MDG3587080.1 M23 family metallopeptidase [Galbibacter pacificus]